MDGRKGFAGAAYKVLPHIPIQMCHFHMKRIVIRHIGSKPIHPAAIDIQNLMHKLGKIDDQLFILYFFNIKIKHLDNLRCYGTKEAQRIVSAIKSIESFLPFLFTYNEHKHDDIPNTNNFLEGAFSHIKEKLKLHRGLNINRKKKAFNFLTKNHPKPRL